MRSSRTMRAEGNSRGDSTSQSVRISPPRLLEQSCQEPVRDALGTARGGGGHPTACPEVGLKGSKKTRTRPLGRISRGMNEWAGEAGEERPPLRRRRTFSPAAERAGARARRALCAALRGPSARSIANTRRGGGG